MKRSGHLSVKEFCAWFAFDTIWDPLRGLASSSFYCINHRHGVGHWIMLITLAARARYDNIFHPSVDGFGSETDQLLKQ
jgi:hypothetical protein